MTMSSRSAYWRWFLVVLLLAGACWTGNLTLYNWWAAGGPASHPEHFEQRASLFSGITVTLVFFSLVLVAAELLRIRAGKGAKS